jgi:predicted metalloendopeptidase
VFPLLLACAQAQSPTDKCVTKVDVVKPELDRIAALQTKAELGGYLAHAQIIDVSAFFTFSTRPDPDDPTHVLPSIGPGGLGMAGTASYIGAGAEQQRVRSQYITMIEQSLRQVGETQSQAETDASTILQLETALARVSGKDTPSTSYLKMPRGDLKKLAAALDWDAFLNGVGMADAKYVYVAQPDFLLGLNTILNHGNIEQMRAYLRWHLLLAAACKS